MPQNIEIGVNAKLNSQQAEAAAKKLGKTLGEVGRQKVELVPDSELRKLEEIERLWNRYLALDRKLARGLHSSGQHGLPFGQVDLGKAGANAAKVARITQFVNGGAMPTPTGQGFAGAAGNAAGAAASHAAAKVTGASPGAAGGGGMSAGFGAGLAGLLGGIAAFGVSKLVGTITENLEKAENLNIGYDKLKRTLGDVNVSFTGLKKAVMDTGDGLKLTYGETAQLASRFTKAGNLKGGDYRSLPEELGIGVGLSQAYGLDPSSGVDMLGRMRGVGVTKDTSESRRFALLIGETIAKSDAFAKADEVMEAIAGFATAQTRQSMAAANVQGYAGMFSAMAASGIPGMDPAGASGMLARMNAALSAGGAKGEASQFFTSMVANRMGLDPLQMQVLREGGMFATKDKMFGVGSAYTRYMGQTGPTGSQDFLSATRALIEEKYAGDSETQKLMRANAFANHTGLNMNQAMAMLSLKPNQMGELQQYAGDMSKLSASGINNMAIARFGTDEQRAGLAQTMLGRDDVSQSHKDHIRDTMERGTAEQQKDVLAKLSAQYEQERTTGKDIADSRALLDNIKTNLADKVVPALTDAKIALLYMAGVKDGKTRDQMAKAVAGADAKDRMNGIESRYKTTRSDLDAEKATVKSEMQRQNSMLASGVLSPSEYGLKMKDLKDRSDAIDAQLDEAKSRYEREVAAEKAATNSRTNSMPAPNAVPLGVSPAAGGNAGNGIGDPGATSSAMKFFMDKGWSREQAAGIVANLKHESNMRPNAVGDSGQAYGIAQWHPDRQRNFERWAGKSIRGSSTEEQLGFVQYELTEGNEKAAGDRLKQATSARDAGAIVSKYYERPLRTNAEASARGTSAEQLNRTPLPDAKSNQAPGAGAGRGSAASYGPLSIAAGSIDVFVKDKSTGQQLQPSQTIPVKIGPPNPDTYSQGAAGSR